MLPGDLNDETWWKGFDSIKRIANDSRSNMRFDT